MRKTKIICTIGPASESPEQLRGMIQRGMNVARLNFSHGTHEEHGRRIQAIRKAAADAGQYIAIMMDTRGPEIRTGLLEDKKITLQGGQRFTLTTRPITGNKDRVHINYCHLPQEVRTGDNILLADGLISLLVEETTEEDIICRVVNGGELGERKGVNVPGIRLNLPFLSEQDIADIRFGIQQGVDYIAASFVRSADDLLEIKRLLEENQASIDIIAKIESQSGVDNLDAIIKLADGVMVARGDLGVEIPAEEVPLVQKQIIARCNQEGKIVIIATQMLESMINNPRPTRAEVSDVANAIFDGADAIMLSGESAAGRYPLEAVETMARIAHRAEQSLPYREILRQKRVQGRITVTDAISYATCATAINLGVSTIITATRSGNTAKNVAKYRPEADIIAVTPDPAICRKLVLVWGVYPVLSRFAGGTDELLKDALKVCLQAGYIKEGDMVVMTGGDPTGLEGGTNLLKVHVAGEVILEGSGIGNKPVWGRIKVIRDHDDLLALKEGDILVCRAAYPEYAPYLSKISALVAEEGGLTSDAAIMGLSNSLPVIVGAQRATELLKDGMLVTIDTTHGRIYKGKVRVM